MKTTFGIAALATLCLSATMVVQETQEASAPSPDMLKRMQPGPMHEKLQPLIGEWTMEGKWRMSPDAEWETFEADVERTWIMDGRFVQETVDSEFMDEPFHGMGIIGYDNVREQYTSVWIENMSTGIWYTHGTLTDGELVFEGKNSDCMTGEKNRWGKSVIGLQQDGQTYEGYAKDDSGEVFMNMKMTASRK